MHLSEDQRKNRITVTKGVLHYDLSDGSDIRLLKYWCDTFSLHFIRTLSWFISVAVSSIVRYILKVQVFFYLNKIFTFLVMRFPFDWKTPLGYLAVISTQSAQTLITGMQFISVLMLISGFCSFSSDFVSDIEQAVREFNRIAMQQTSLTIKEEIELKQRLNGIAQFHAEAIKFCIVIHFMKIVFLTFFPNSLDLLTIFRAHTMELSLCIWFSPSSLYAICCW